MLILSLMHVHSVVLGVDVPLAIAADGYVFIWDETLSCYHDLAGNHLYLETGNDGVITPDTYYEIDEVHS